MNKLKIFLLDAHIYFVALPQNLYASYKSYGVHSLKHAKT